ncbi:MAG: sigma-70 family RNA polymerase sigma factor [Clostridia bacterium]|nr:sigma-70 family RNA polymerase sigma factor [Clostridia bacterium]
MNDQDVRKAIQGNKDAFSTIINEIKEKSYRIAFCYLKNEHDSLDAISNSILFSFKYMRKLKNPEYFTTWFTRILINECKKIIKKGHGDVDLSIMENNLIHEDHYSDTDLIDKVLLLSEHERMIIYLKYYQGYTLEEISDILELPLNTVKSKLYRSLKQLKEEVEKSGR